MSEFDFELLKPRFCIFHEKTYVVYLITCRLKCFGSFHLSAKGIKLSFTLERAASNEYPLQTFSLRNKKIALWVSIALDLVPNSLYCKDILASDSQRNMKIGKWWGLAHPHESL